MRRRSSWQTGDILQVMRFLLERIDHDRSQTLEISKKAVRFDAAGQALAEGIESQPRRATQ